MFMRHHLFSASLAFILLACCATGAIAHPACTVHKTLNNTQAVPTGAEIEVQNLVGHVTVQQGGPQLKVVATVVASGKNTAAAQALANRIRLTVHHKHDKLVVHIHYPVDQYDSYQYIRGKGEPTSSHSVHFLGFTLHGSSGSTDTEYQGQRVSVYRGRDKGAPLHVDLVVSLPAGSHASIHDKVGRIDASHFKGALHLVNDSGDIVAKHLDGQLKANADSGDVTVNDLHGTLVVDADSGDVNVADIHGDTTVEADSGDVTAHGIHGNQLKLEADSGDIRVNDASGTLKLEADSGDIWLKNPGAVPHLHADSDSGDVHVSGALSGLASFNIESDAGDVTLSTTEPPAVHLDIQGDDVNVDWPSLSNVQSSEHHFSGDVGKATGQGRISADSGDVNLTR